MGSRGGGGGGRFPVGDYVVGKQIGSGSFSTVWHARHRVHGTEVAIKEILTGGLNSKLRDSLKSEIVILHKINHPNIIRLHDMIEESGKIYIILEYCRGGDLSVYIQKRQGKIPEATAKHFMHQLASGLKVLRENNLIHRDLKPQILLLSANDDKSILKIADFGFARSLQPRGLAETLCGSPLYMAPEIMQLQKYDAKADLWSAGTILYQLVIGKTPYTGSNQIQLLQNIMKTELQFPPDIKDISPLCIDLCQKLLRRNPVERLTFEEFFNHPFLCQRPPEELQWNMTPLRVIDGFPLSHENHARNAEECSQEDCLPFSLDDDCSGPDGAPLFVRKAPLRSTYGFSLPAKFDGKEFSSASRKMDMTSDYRSVSHKPEMNELNFRGSKLPEETMKESLESIDSEVAKSQSKVSADSLELIDQDYVLVSSPPVNAFSMLSTCKLSNLQSKSGSPLKLHGDAVHNPPTRPLTDIRFRMIPPLYTHQNPLPHEGHGPTRPTTTYENGTSVLSTQPQPQPQPPVGTSTSNVAVAVAAEDDIDLSDAILNYINQILMEEDMEDRVYMLQDSLDLQAKQQSLYEALGNTQPPNGHHHLQSANDSLSVAPCSILHATYATSCIKSPGWINGSHDHDASSISDSIPDGYLGSTEAPLPTPDESKSVSNFRKGVEEANKFLPADNQIFNFSADAILFPQDEAKQGVFKMEKKDLRVRKNPYYNGDVNLEEERSIKQAAIYPEPVLRSEQFDIVLLHSMGEGAAALGAYRETLQAEKSKTLQRNRQQNGSSGRKGRGKRQSGKKKEVVDLRTLLVRCAQAAAADDHRAASELLKTIKQNSSPFGDGNQRLAYCFADGLEARIGGTGSQIYKALVNKKTLAVDFLKAYHLYLASCPFRKISIFCANRTILNRAKEAMRVHIIDFGILYGFQWPTLIQHFAGREGGPPKLKITGIEFPQSGFRPAEQVEETGRRLAEYAKMFGVPFEYNAIAKRWDTIKAEDIKIEEGELVVVNCMYRFKNIPDETSSLESSRSIVLNTVKEIKPDIFVHGVVNGAYNAPFFVTRFREALFHFSSLFDMLEATVPREIPERMLIEKEIFGREALNVIACEGWERVERPETYKQWQVRNVKAGFNQIPFDREFMATATMKVSYYHKDFVIDEDGKWLLLGWKGRTIYAMSCWQPL